MAGPERLKWVAVDLDGTLAKSVWPEPGIGDPIWSAWPKVHGLVEHGYKVVIHTSRSWEAYEEIEAWLIKHALPFSRIVCGKLLAVAYIDDRNISIDAESWLP